MKKLIAAIVAVVLLMSVTVYGVSAESTFVFEQTNREVYGELMLIEWNEIQTADDTVVIQSVKIGGRTKTVDIVETDSFSVDISSVLAGRHEVQVVYTVNGTQKTADLDPLVIVGERLVKLSLSINSGCNPVVKATDANGDPIKGYKVVFVQIGDMENQAFTTKADGTYTYLGTINYGDNVVCKGERTVIGDVTYSQADEVQVTYQKPATTTTTTTTTTVEGETTTTVEGETTTTAEGTTTTQHGTTFQPTVNANATTADSAQTVQTIRGAGTTSQQDGRIALNVSLDENILNAFGVKKSDFANRARLLLTKEDYNNLVGRTAHQLMLNVLTAKTEPSLSQINAAISGVSKYSAYDEEHRKMVTFDLSFLKLKSSTGEVVPVSALPLNSTYIVQLPVPAEMKDCEMLAITMFNGDSLMEPMEVKVEGGAFSLEINSLEAYTLIGFGAEESSAGGSNSVILIILMIIGILLLIAAAVLVYLFIIRKPAPKAVEATPAFVPTSFDENDIFSGREDISEINRRPNNDKN